MRLVLRHPPDGEIRWNETKAEVQKMFFVRATAWYQYQESGGDLQFFFLSFQR